jgi:hypothetical protein
MTDVAILGFLGLALLAAHEAWFIVRHAVRCKDNKIGDRCTCPLSHRLLAGRTFHGVKVTDATYWRRADKADGHVSPFQKLPKWQRRLLRTGPFLAVCGALISWPLTVAAVSLVTACWALARFGGRIRLPSRLVPGRLRDRLGRHHGSRRQDMAQALGSITGTASVTLKRDIDWNPEYAAAEPGDRVVTWYLPRGFKASPRERTQVEDLWRGRVGFDLEPRWETAEARPHVNFIRARALPDLVYLRDYAEDLAKLPPNKIGLGLDDRGELVCQDWDVENPHSLVVAGSRHGKTELNRSKTAQVTRKGGHVSAADCKRISFQGLEGIPGFELENNPRDIRGMWELVCRSYEEMERRALERERNPTAEFDPWVTCIEELGQFSEMTGDWWDELEFENPLDEGTLFFRRRGRKIPRVWRYVKSLCFEGAEFDMHVDIDGQDGDHQYLKGLKPVLGLRVLGGFQDNQWINCVGTRPVPQAPDVKGRFCLVNGRKQTWFQAFVGDRDKLESAAIWRDFARAGRRLDGTAPVTATVDKPFTVTSKGTVYTPQNGWSAQSAATLAAAPATDLATPMSLLEITKTFLLPRGSREEQAKFAQVLRQDRYRSDKGELPDGLRFPEPAEVADDGRQTEKFIPAGVIEFNEARRGRRVA